MRWVRWYAYPVACQNWRTPLRGAAWVHIESVYDTTYSAGSSFGKQPDRHIRWVRWFFDNPQFLPENAAMTVRELGPTLRQFTPAYGLRLTVRSRLQKPSCLLGPYEFTACSTSGGGHGEDNRHELRRHSPAGLHQTGSSLFSVE